MHWGLIWRLMGGPFLIPQWAIASCPLHSTTSCSAHSAAPPPAACLPPGEYACWVPYQSPLRYPPPPSQPPKKPCWTGHSKWWDIAWSKDNVVTKPRPPATPKSFKTSTKNPCRSWQTQCGGILSDVGRAKKLILRLKMFLQFNTGEDWKLLCNRQLEFQQFLVSISTEFLAYKFWNENPITLSENQLKLRL